jgi:glycosyltransferase involved in cell wall biosynthesis/peptidoglycan/xylan/chitin deacetylase (PgdA/CDA1 family)
MGAGSLPQTTGRAPRTRVLLAVHSAKRAGAQHVALGQARSMRCDMDFVIAVGGGSLRPAFAEIGEVVRGPTSLPVWGASPGRWALQLVRAVPDAVRFAILVRRHRVDILLAGSSVLAGAVLGARLGGVPAIVQVHEAPTSAAARRLFRFHGAVATTVVAISPWTARELGATRAAVRLIRPGIPVPPDPGPRPPRSGEPWRLAVVGTIDRHKRQHVAVEALGVLRDRGVDARLTLIGLEADRAYAGEVRALAHGTGVGGRVTFAGPSDDVAAHLLAADALLLPGGEVAPLVLMEAMALRTPVVAARMGAIPDLVADGVSGLLAPPDDPGALADAVVRLRNEDGLTSRLAAAGRRQVEERFDERSAQARLQDEIDRLVAEGRAPRRRVRRRLGAAGRTAGAALLRWRLRLSGQGVALALVYHEVHRAAPVGGRVTPGIAEAALQRHARHLRRCYRPVTASQLHDAMRARRRGGRIPVAVTFDDDLAAHAHVAAPLLRTLGCPATFFLSGAGLDAPHAFWWQRLQAALDRGLDPRPALRAAGVAARADRAPAELAAELERLTAASRAGVDAALSALIGEDPAQYRLTRDAVAALAADGFEIGFHTLRHEALDTLGGAELARALRAGRADLEAAAGRPLTAIAYPHGRADARVAAAARAAGFRDGFIGPAGPLTPATDRLRIGRAEVLLEDADAFALVLVRVLRAGRQPVGHGAIEGGTVARGPEPRGVQR